MITFETFTPGANMGQATAPFDEDAFRLWTELFPDDAAHRPLMPPGMVSMLVMRAYMSLLTPRPPGNVHARQRFGMHALPRLGDEITTQLTCLDKELRRERRWVHLGSESRDQNGTLLFTSRMGLIWAA